MRVNRHNGWTGQTKLFFEVTYLACKKKKTKIIPEYMPTCQDSRNRQLHRMVEYNPPHHYHPRQQNALGSQKSGLDRIMYYIPRQDVQGSKKVNYNPLHHYNPRQQKHQVHRRVDYNPITITRQNNVLHSQVGCTRLKESELQSSSSLPSLTAECIRFTERWITILHQLTSQRAGLQSIITFLGRMYKAQRK